MVAREHLHAAGFSLCRGSRKYDGVSVSVCVSLCVFACVHVCVCICMCAYVCASVCVSVCMCMCVLHVCVHVCIHTPGKDLKLVFGKQQGATVLWELVCGAKTNNASIHKVRRAVNRAWTSVRWVWKSRYQNIMLRLNTSARVEENTPNIPNQGKECSTNSFPYDTWDSKSRAKSICPQTQSGIVQRPLRLSSEGQAFSLLPIQWLGSQHVLTTKVILRTC